MNPTSKETLERGQQGWMSLAEAADYLSKPRSWMYDNYKRLGIPHVPLGRHVRFHREQLDKWMLSRMENRFDYVTLR